VILRLRERLAALETEANVVAKRLYGSSADQVALNHRKYESPLRQFSKDFLSLHQDLVYLPVPWAQAELELFVRTIIAQNFPQNHSQAQVLSDSWSIAFESDYSFANVVPDDLIEPSRAPFDSPNILTIPAIESHNPVMWANLVHELGHHISNVCGIADSAADLEIITTAAPGLRDYTKDWLPEIIADLIALDYIGPSYLLSLITFSTFWYARALNHIVISHPPLTMRANYLVHRLRKRSLTHFTDLFDTLSRERQLPWFYRLEGQARYSEQVSKWEELVGMVGRGRDTHDPARARYLNDVADAIVALPEYMAAVPHPFGATDYEITERLNYYLSINQVVATQRELPRQVSLPQVRENYVAQLALVEEVPSRTSHIVAAGVFAALGFHADMRKSVNRYQCGRYPMALALRAYFERLRANGEEHRLMLPNVDKIVARSMEAASIVTFYRAENSDGRSQRAETAPAGGRNDGR
jgi:hypothetical protein